MKTRIMLVICSMLAACSGGGPTTPATNNNPPAGGNPGGVQSANVSMRSEEDTYYGGTTHAFSPGSVTVARGGSVTWTNNTDFAHSVTFSTAAGAPSDVVPMSNSTATRSFTTSGTFAYSCSVHQGMTGVVTVQ